MKLQERFRQHLQAKGKIPMDKEEPKMMADGGRVDYSQDEFHDDSDEWVDGDYNDHDTHAYAFGGEVEADEVDQEDEPRMKKQFAMALARRGR